MKILYYSFRLLSLRERPQNLYHFHTNIVRKLRIKFVYVSYIIGIRTNETE